MSTSVKRSVPNLVLARFYPSRVLDVAVVTSRQLSAPVRLIGHGWTTLLSHKMTQATVFDLSDTEPSSNIVTQLIMKIKARVSSQQKQNPVKIQVKRSRSIYLNPGSNGLCQNCSYKLMTECRAQNTVIIISHSGALIDQSKYKTGSSFTSTLDANN